MNIAIKASKGGKELNEMEIFGIRLLLIACLGQISLISANIPDKFKFASTLQIGAYYGMAKSCLGDSRNGIDLMMKKLFEDPLLELDECEKKIFIQTANDALSVAAADLGYEVNIIYGD